MNKKLLATAGLITALALTGCSTPTSVSAPSVAPAGPTSGTSATGASAAATTAAAAAPVKSSRGNIIKTIGAGAGMTNASGETIASFVVTAIDMNPTCTGLGASPAANGHLVVLTVEAETKPELAKEAFPTFSLAGMGWKAIAENGTTQNQDTFTAPAFMCLPDAERFPSGMGPGEKATGKIVLDVVSPTGTLVYKALGAPAGWEWAYPGK